MAPDARAARWKLSDVQREIAQIEPNAKKSLAGFVLSKLRGRWAVPQHCEMLLLQGYALKLHSLGFGVVLHRASAEAIRATIFLSAKSQYLQALKVAQLPDHCPDPPWPRPLPRHPNLSGGEEVRARQSRCAL